MKIFGQKAIVLAVACGSLLFSGYAIAGCNPVSACSNTSQVPATATCSDYFLETGVSDATTKTYCTNCSACVAGKNDCIKGDAGCHSCNINNGKKNYTGIQCSGNPGQCADGGNQNFTCTS